jgi:Xaa-Pro aminopeptidase
VGIAEVLVTMEGAQVLTDVIEASRLEEEELPEGTRLRVDAWHDSARREAHVAQTARLEHGGVVLSDRPRGDEHPLPPALLAAKRTLCDAEIGRYRVVGRLAAEAMTDALLQARSHMSERDLAGLGACALWRRGLHPALTLVAGETRLPRHRHGTPTAAPLGDQAMLVFCARGFGLYANLTRFVRLRRSSWAASASLDGDASRHDAQAEKAHALVREVEADVLDATRPDASLSDLHAVIAASYARHGIAEALHEHHQGGTTGYLAREVVARPATRERLAPRTAVAWNPSVRGAKVEDTFLLDGEGCLEVLTRDPVWPTVEVRHRARPVPLLRLE